MGRSLIDQGYAYLKDAEMATPQNLDLIFELDVKKSEKKVGNSTKNLVMSILQEAGFDGVWEVRDSRQIKKKGRGRFGVIRLESRSGRLGIRVWCKPRGNETCFEYSLVPPSGVDIQEAFAVLKRVNGVTLKIPESGVIPFAIEGRMLGIPPVPTRMEQIVEVCEFEGGETKSDSSLKVDNLESAEVSSEFPSLIVSIGEQGDSGMDKALVAIGLVAVDGYAERAEAFDSMVKQLGLKELARKKGVGLDESLRILTSAMKDARGYIRRVRHSSKNKRNSAEGIVGFKLTGKGQERLEEIRTCYGPEVEERLGAGWRVEDSPSVDGSVSKSEASSAVLPDAIVRIKELVASYEEAARQVEEHDQVLGPIDDGIRALEADISELDRSAEGLKRKIQELQEEVSGIESNRSSMEGDLEKKLNERREWSALKQPHSKEKARVESILFGLGVLK